VTTWNTGDGVKVLVDEQAWRQVQELLKGHEAELQRMKQAILAAGSVSQADQFMAAAMALCNHLATHMNAQRVALGLLQGRQVRVRAVNHIEKITRQMRVIVDMELAMEEALDQNVEIVYPEPADPGYITRFTRQYAQQYQAQSLLLIPLRKGDDAVGVLLLERETNTPFTLAEATTLRLTCELATARLLDLFERQRWFGARLATQTKKSLAWFVGPKQTWLKVSALAVIVGLIGSYTIHGPRKAEGTCIIQAVNKRVYCAPFEGKIEAVYVEPGDVLLAPGQPVTGTTQPTTQPTTRGSSAVLAKLETIELQMRLASAQGEHLTALQQSYIARRDGKTAEAQMAEAQAAKAQADIDLLNWQIRQATIQTELPGTVFSGDLKHKVGTVVKTGEVLFEVGDPHTLCADIYIPEDMIVEVTRQQRGLLATSSYPDRKIAFAVERINPIAQVYSSQNVFVVRVQLHPGPNLPDLTTWLRPGMEGVAQIEVAQAPYLDIWTRRLVNWVRMKLWL